LLHSTKCSVAILYIDPQKSYIYTLSLHDALPIYDRARRLELGLRTGRHRRRINVAPRPEVTAGGNCVRASSERSPSPAVTSGLGDRKSTRLNSSHVSISYAVFCLKKKIKDDVYHH